jgi:NAD(P)H-hydrate epimerase
MSGELTQPAPPSPAGLTRDEVREVDRIAIEDFRVPGVVLMENAALAVLDVALGILDDFRVRKVLVLCGGGNNGGDGLAVARHLHNRGADVTVALTIDPARFKGDALVNWQIIDAMRLSVIDAKPDIIRAFDDALVIDAIFGTGLSEPPREPFSAIVQAIADSENPVLAVDVPSGLDCDTGEPLGPAAVVADRTVTFVAPKAGFLNPAAARYLGEVIVGDIGCPREAIRRAIAGERTGG